MTAPIGIMMLDTVFPRPPGDVGHVGSWPFPVLFETVPGAHVRHVVGQAPSRAVIDLFVAAGERLVARGACALLTSCGFLVLAQAELAARLPVPVATSALLLVPLVAQIHAPHPVGVLTYDRAALTEAHLAAAGADISTPLTGLSTDSAFHGMVERGAAYDATRFEAEIVALALQLVRERPDLAALVLECTNFPPFAAAVARATKRPVFDILTLGRLVQSGLVPCSFRASRDSA